MATLIKFTVFIKRKDGLSIEDFNKYWSDHHAEVFKSIPIVKKNLVKYTQYHVNTEASAIVGAVMPVAPFDGAAIFYARTQEDLLAVFSDPHYQSVVIPDEEQFLDRPSCQGMIGYEEIKMESTA
ncbi:hypothetical protein EXIGLDRAFT_45469 [Exidia glandulosa HHB12029]|uniref:EthD domain-containing protein n=1 Tax=Exidia glandulosa HHB12029 TaxID=1314781 RepID=A0A165IIB7_EXIGL|nr:hypothetical protein EXIGLDRAFT_45469 [Exidia glandulosa HHB12029]